MQSYKTSPCVGRFGTRPLIIIYDKFCAIGYHTLECIEYVFPREIASQIHCYMTWLGLTQSKPYQKFRGCSSGTTSSSRTNPLIL